MGDRIVVMHEGHIQQVGTPEELYDQPVNKFVAGFIGTPAMGFLTCRFTRTPDGALLEGTGVRIALPARRAGCLTGDNGEVLVGIRPEHLQPAGTAAAVDGGGSRVRGVVEVVEPLGPEQHVVVDVGGETLTARTGRDSSIKVADKIVFTVDGSLVHLFDPASGLALR